VRSIAAGLSGDIEAARRIKLVLPQTGVCNGRASAQDAALLRRRAESWLRQRAESGLQR
jgi:hypothetical protein